MLSSEGNVRHIFICGAKSLGQYGGYETFVERISGQLQNDAGLKLHITCKANGEGCMDERALSGVRYINENEFEYHNAHCIKLPVPDIGPAAAIYYDRASVLWCIHYCLEHNIKSPVIYILTCRIGPFIAGLKRKIRRLEGSLQLNPDGHEWMRKKWPAPVRAYWKMSERQMVRQADLIICDSLNIEEYIRREYSRYKPETVYIAYGVELEKSALADDDPTFTEWMHEKGIRPRGYFLAVGRFVPENNYETMINEFMHSDTEKNLVLITNSNDKLYAQLEEKLHFSNDRRIIFAGSLYNPGLLEKIRENAFAYIHGHEVGGTNPGLLEGLGSTGLSLLYDVRFNREVARDSALYWTKETGSLAAGIKMAEELPPAAREQYCEKAREQIRSRYSWEYIASLYRAVWEKN